MDIKKLKASDIRNMDYNQLISLVKETNRPPGGIDSISHILQKTFLNESSKILEIGTSTGFTAIEISKFIHCHITGIDINMDSLKEARKRASVLKLRKLKFIKADVLNLPFKNSSFDLAFCGNVLSIVNSFDLALKECVRVLKENSYIVFIPIYYVKTPPKEIVKKVSSAINVNITVKYKDEVIRFYDESLGNNFERIDSTDFVFSKITEKKIHSFVNNIMGNPHLRNLSKESYDVCFQKYLESMLLFKNNLSHMGYSILIYRKSNFLFDPILFTGEKVLN